MGSHIGGFMGKEISLASIFELENDPHLLDFKTYDDVPIWMIGRFYLLYRVVGGKVFHYQSPDHNRRISLKMISFVLRAMTYNFVHQRIFKNKQIYLYTTNRKTFLENEFYNRYVDPFYEMFPEETVVMEQALLDWEWPFPRRNKDVYFDTLGRIGSEIKGRCFNRRDDRAVGEMLNYFCARARAIMGITISREELIKIDQSIVRMIAVMRNQAEWFGRRLSNRTKVVITVGAGFPYYYFFNKMLKRKGIISIELQHGYITKNNIMYNYAKNIVSDDRVAAGLPNYIFTYGEWWNTQMNCPIEKVSIGNPYHDLCVKGLRRKNRNTKSILVIGIGENTEKSVVLAAQLADHLKEYQICFRPHPGERENALRTIKNENLSVEIDDQVDLYTSLASRSIVVGEVSTVLFEAAGIVDRIFVWNTEYTRAFLPEHPFEIFDTLEQLLERIDLRDESLNGQNESFWAKGWEKNYHEFIRKIQL